MRLRLAIWASMCRVRAACLVSKGANALAEGACAVAIGAVVVAQVAQRARQWGRDTVAAEQMAWPHRTGMPHQSAERPMHDVSTGGEA